MITLRYFLFVFVLLHIGLAKADSSVEQLKPGSSAYDTINNAVKASFPELSINSIYPTELKTIFQVELSSGEILHIDSTGRYMLPGDLYQLNGVASENGVSNITEEYRTEKRSKLFVEMKKEGFIVYPAKGEKRGEVFVFTDTDCGYCRKFHAEIPQLNLMGIEVSYLAWPRAGVRSKTGKVMTDIWCAKDKLVAMDMAKTGREKSIESTGSCDHPIAEHLAFGRQLGVRGTPAIFLPNGKQVGGYLSASSLAKALSL